MVAVHADWIRNLSSVMDAIERDGEPPYESSGPVRASKLAVYSVACAPCCAWSFIWRVLLCPCSCFTHGAAAVCSNNNCTTISDAAIVECYKHANRRAARVSPIVDPLGKDDVIGMLIIVERLEAVFKDNVVFDAKHYALATYVVTPLSRTLLQKEKAGEEEREVRPYLVKAVLKECRDRAGGDARRQSAGVES